ncbi:hypothetical protein AeMF1_013601 [Aphanomyces euteiches]|nr:hypothetical protein AeMF1_013601 [Aphanomyces euteiches]
MASLQRRRSKRVETRELQREFNYLRERLSSLVKRNDDVQEGNNPFALVAQVLKEYQSPLMEHEKSRNKLAQMLFFHVNGIVTRVQDPQPKATWMDSSLTGNLNSRPDGYAWLSQKAYHMSEAAFPPTLAISPDDMIQVKANLGEDDGGHVAIDALEAVSQLTVYANFKDVAREFWASQIQSNNFSTCEVVDQVNENLMYYSQRNHSTGTKQFYVMGIFEDGNRIVVTQTMVAKDECYPLQERESRFQGVGWIVLERMEENLTAYRRLMHYIPVNVNGALSVEEIGQLFRRQVRGVEHRLALIEQVCSEMETILSMQCNYLHDSYKKLEA